jgi:uncharacterized lipoprotein YmbA
MPIGERASAARAGLVLGLSVLFLGCGTTPKESFYALSAVAALERPDAANAHAALTVIVDTVTVPELVDRPQFVVSIGENRVILLEQQRWAEPLKAQIARTVAMNLTRLIGSAHVWTQQQAGRNDADRRVALDVQRFESRPGDAVIVEVLWIVRSGAAAPAKSGRSAVRERIANDGYDALIAAHNRAIAAVSRDIAAAIRK